jgi:SAM-dependent methyltransferase
MRALLRHASVYTLLQRLLGADQLHHFCVREMVRPRPGDTVLDLGCGPADILRFMPEVKYTGVDVSPEYIAAARAAYGDRGTFICAPARPEALPARAAFDLVLATEVLHHLDDAATAALFDTARAAVKPGGRFVAWDPCWYPGQSPIARWLIRHDRGMFVREVEAYVSLARRVFPSVTTTVRHDLLRVPYSLVFMECALTT